MKLLIGWLLAIQALLAGCSGANNTDVELVFTEKDVQAAIDRAQKSKPMLNGLLIASLDGSPIVKLGEPPGRIGITAQLALAMGSKSFSGQVVGSTGLNYDDSKKTFFLDAPQIDTIDAPVLPKNWQSKLQVTASTVLANYMNSVPIYTLPDDGSVPQRTARRFLKSIQIRKGEMVAILSVR